MLLTMFLINLATLLCSGWKLNPRSRESQSRFLKSEAISLKLPLYTHQLSRNIAWLNTSLTHLFVSGMWLWMIGVRTAWSVCKSMWSVNLLVSIWLWMVNGFDTMCHVVTGLSPEVLALTAMWSETLQTSDLAEVPEVVSLPAHLWHSSFSW